MTQTKLFATVEVLGDAVDKATVEGRTYKWIKAKMYQKNNE